jgi:hypothetical protein
MLAGNCGTVGWVILHFLVIFTIRADESRKRSQKLVKKIIHHSTPAGKRHVSTWPFQIPVHTLSAFQFSAKAALLAWRTARLSSLDQWSASCGKNVCCDALLS